jgi:hypothetical protein
VNVIKAWGNLPTGLHAMNYGLMFPDVTHAGICTPTFTPKMTQFRWKPTWIIMIFPLFH